MKRFEVHIHGGYIDFPGFGRCPTGECVTVEAEDEKAARPLALAKASVYPQGEIRQVTEVHRYAVTLRGKRDKRRRETVIVFGTDTYSAVRHLQYHQAACSFAGSIRKNDDPRIVKIEVLA